MKPCIDLLLTYHRRFTLYSLSHIFPIKKHNILETFSCYVLVLLPVDRRYSWLQWVCDTQESSDGNGNSLPLNNDQVFNVANTLSRWNAHLFITQSLRHVELSKGFFNTMSYRVCCTFHRLLLEYWFPVISARLLDVYRVKQFLTANHGSVHPMSYIDAAVGKIDVLLESLLTRCTFAIWMSVNLLIIFLRLKWYDFSSE